VICRLGPYSVANDINVKIAEFLLQDNTSERTTEQVKVKVSSCFVMEIAQIGAMNAPGEFVRHKI